jgi:hypothetical protein
VGEKKVQTVRWKEYQQSKVNAVRTQRQTGIPGGGILALMQYFILRRRIPICYEGSMSGGLTTHQTSEITEVLALVMLMKL